MDATPMNAALSQSQAPQVRTTGIAGMTTATEERALALLGSGLSNSVVAHALGVSESRISQLLSNESFSTRVTELKIKNLESHNKRDASLDSLEDKLIARVDRHVDFMDGKEAVRALAVVNNAKRRGVASADNITQQQTIVQLTLPSKVINQFTTNVANQVVMAGAQSLVTIQSAHLLSETNKQLAAMELMGTSQGAIPTKIEENRNVSNLRSKGVIDVQDI
jgi:hypothetical protein